MLVGVFAFHYSLPPTHYNLHLDFFPIRITLRFLRNRRRKRSFLLLGSWRCDLCLWCSWYDPGWNYFLRKSAFSLRTLRCSLLHKRFLRHRRNRGWCHLGHTKRPPQPLPQKIFPFSRGILRFLLC